MTDRASTADIDDVQGQNQEIHSSFFLFNYLNVVTRIFMNSERKCVEQPYSS